MKQKIIGPVCASLAVMLFLLAACSAPATRSGMSSGSADASATGAPPTSGWILAEETGSAGLPEEAQAAFDRAVKQDDKNTLEPVVLLGQQVVSGMNYAIICKNTLNAEEPQAKLQLLTIYQNLKGKAKVTGNEEFYLVDYSDSNATAPMEEILAGGWSTPESYETGNLPEPVKSAFDKAVKEQEGEGLQPVAYLGSRTEDGTVYAVLCATKSVGQNPITVLELVTVHEKSDGSVEVKSECAIDPNPEMVEKEEAINRETEEGYEAQ